MTHIVARNVITPIRMPPSTLLMGLTCFKLRRGVWKQSEMEEEEEEARGNLDFFVTGGYLRRQS